MGEEDVVGVPGVEPAGDRGQFAIELMEIDIEEDAGDRLPGRNAAKRADKTSSFISHNGPDDGLEHSPIVRFDPGAGRLEQAAEDSPEWRPAPDRDRIRIGINIPAQDIETPAPGIRTRAAVSPDVLRKPADGVPPGHALAVGEQFRRQKGRGRFIDNIGDDAVNDEVGETEGKNVAPLSLDADFTDAPGPEGVGVMPDSPHDEAGEAPAPVEHGVKRHALLAENPAFGGGRQAVEEAFDLPAVAAAVAKGAVKVDHVPVSSRNIR
jgi:hypothetical protein